MARMELGKWLAKAKIGQRELARLVGYSSNGMVHKILAGKAHVPQDHIPKWADALQLTGKDRDKFIKEASVSAIPDWQRDEVATLEKRISWLEKHTEQREQRERLATYLLLAILAQLPDDKAQAIKDAFSGGDLPDDQDEIAKIVRETLARVGVRGRKP